MFEIISRHFWAVAILVTSINVAILKARSARHIRANPELAEGYAILLRGYLIWMNIPWIVMGVGCTVGGVPTVWHYFRPRDGNPYVLAWFASVFIVWIAVTCWIIFRGGAELLVKHPGALNMNTTSPTMVKLFWLLSLAAGIVAVVVMCTRDIQLPPTR